MVDVKEFGAVGDGEADDTEAIQEAITTLAPGEVLFFPAGTYLVTPGGEAPFEVAECVVMGESRDASKIKAALVDGYARIFQVQSGRVELRSLTVEGPDSFGEYKEGEGHANISVLGCDGVDGISVVATDVLVRRLHCAVRTFAGKQQSVELDGCEVDAEEIGMAGGEAQIQIFGVLSAALGPVVCRDSVFRRGGCTVQVPEGRNHSHQIYVSEKTPLRVSGCRFYEHMDGRYIQVNGDVEGAPDPAFYLVESCYFGPYAVADTEGSSPTMIHTSPNVVSVVDSCVFDEHRDECIGVKGDTVICGGTVFRYGGEGYFGASIRDYGNKPNARITIGPGVVFDCNETFLAYLSEDGATDLELHGCSAGQAVYVASGEDHRIRSRGTRWNKAGVQFIHLAGGTCSLLDVQGDEFGPEGNFSIRVTEAATVELLRLKDNWFHCGFSPEEEVELAGTVKAEEISGNRGYP